MYLMNYREALILGAVSIGSLLLIGPLAAVALIGAVQMVARLFGEGLAGGQYAALVLISVIVGVKAAHEVAVIRIHGYDAVRRGSAREVWLRTGLLGLPIIGGFVMITSFLVSMTQWGLRGEPIILGMVALVLAVLAWSLMKTVRAYRSGRTRRANQP